MFNVKQSASIEINQKISELKNKGKKTTILSLGEAFFDIPDYGIKKIFENGHHYSDSKGIFNLRKKLTKYYSKKYSCSADPKSEIIISSVSKILTYMIFLIFLKKKDEAICFDPSWLSYEDQIKLVGSKIKYIKLDPELKYLENAINKKTKILILNNPNNPSGIFFDKQKLEKIYKIYKKKKILILSDEAYSDFIPDNKKFFSIGHFDKKKENTIIVNSISKNFGMSGWRIGYAISNKKIIGKLLILNQQLITCAPTLLQLYVEKYFQKILSNNKEQIKKLLIKRSKINEYLLKNNFDFIDSDCTFYIFLKIKKNNVKFTNYLIKKYGISVVPGKFYGHYSKNYVRMSLGVEPLNKIINEFKIIKNYL